MASEFTWLSDLMPVWAFVLVFVLAYAILAKIKILGESRVINSVIAIILSIIFISFTSIREYVTNLTPLFAVLIVVLFFFFFIIAFMIKNPESFTKPITIVFVVIFSIILIVMLFYNFPDARAILPESIACDTDGYDNHYDYGYDYFDENKCYRYEDDYRCYKSGHYYWYDKCTKKDGYYKCYDYEYYDDYRYDDCYGNGTTDKIRGWLYKDEIRNSFYLILAALIVGFIITRK